jgi:YVTN family beta-propeller protein
MISKYDPMPPRPVRTVPLTASFALAGAFAFLTGCAMDHGSIGDPSSTPIAPVGSGALYVVNGGSNSLTVINTATNEVLGAIALKNAAFPHISADNSLIALAIPGVDLSGGHEAGHGGHGTTGAVLLLDASTGATKAGRRFDYSNHNAAFSPDGKETWTSQMTSPGKILVLDASTLATLKTIEVGKLPAEVTFTLSGKYAFAANGGSNDVTVIDAGAKTVVKTIAVGANPVGAWPGKDSIMYVDNEAAKSLTAIHGETLEVLRTYDLGFTPAMAATTAGGELWVTDTENGKVVFYPAGSTAKSGELATGAGAHAIAFAKDGKLAYVTNQGAGTVSVIDVVSRTLSKSIAVGSKPNGIIVR